MQKRMQKETLNPIFVVVGNGQGDKESLRLRLHRENAFFKTSNELIAEVLKGLITTSISYFDMCYPPICIRCLVNNYELAWVE